MTMTTAETKQPAVGPDANPGQETWETNAAVALPGDVGQLYKPVVGNVVLHGVVLDEGGELQKIVAGPLNIVPNPDGSWTFGQHLSSGAYIIALVKNVSKETVTLKGAFLVSVAPGSVAGGTNAAGPAPGSLTSPHSPSGLGSTSPRPPASAGGSTVTPGSNEVAILLPYGEAKRVLEAINGGSPISDAERAGIARAIHDGFHRSGMR